MAIEVSSYREDEFSRFGLDPVRESTVRLEDFPDPDCVQDTRDAAAPVFQNTPRLTSDQSLEGRVSLSDTPAEEITEAPALNLEELEMIQDEINGIKFLSDGPNFLIKVREVVAKILAQFNRISEKDRIQIDEMKSKYRKASQESANYQRKLGDAGLVISGIGLAILLGQFGFANDADRAIMKFVSEQAPNVGGMFTSRYQANQKEADALAGLVLAEYNAKTSKGQSESGSKQEILNLLEKVLDSLKRAAMAG